MELPTSSLNVVFPSAGEIALVHEELPALQDNQLLCKATASLVSIGTEGRCLRGDFDEGTYWADYIKYPFQPGYSMSGVVLAVGDGVSSFKPGDRICTWAPHSQYFVQDENLVYPIPECVSDEEASWGTLACTTQLGVRRAELEMGEVVVVIGLGILGQLVVQYAALSGASQVIAVDPSAFRLQLAKESGATGTICGPVGSAMEEVRAMTNGDMADVVFDVTGHPSVLSSASTLLRKLGRLVLLGDCTTPSQQCLGPRIVGDSITIIGVHGLMYPDTESPWNRWTAARMTCLFFAFIEAGRIKLGHLVTHRRDPTAAPEVYTKLATDAETVLGIVFDWKVAGSS